MPVVPKSSDAVVVPKIQITKVEIPVEGISDLIVHAWTEKAKQMMRDKQQKQAKTKKEAKVPQDDFEGAKYKNAKGQDCVLAAAFKNAIIDAASFSDGVTKVILRGALFIEGELLPIEYDKCEMREDMVRIGMGTADLRYRPVYKGWRVKLPIQFNSSVLSIEQIVNLINLAGFSIGVCEWRPQCNGDFGRFRVAA